MLVASSASASAFRYAMSSGEATRCCSKDPMNPPDMTLTAGQRQQLALDANSHALLGNTALFAGIGVARGRRGAADHLLLHGLEL